MHGAARKGIVLIVEDEPIIAFALEDILLDLGFEQVLLAGNLAEAQRLIESNPLSAAVLDVNIHGQQSYGLALHLRDRGIPFIFATGYGDAQHPEALSSVSTVTKPYNQAMLEIALAGATI